MEDPNLDNRQIESERMPRNPRVLIVEDDGGSEAYLRTVLGMTDAEVEKASLKSAKDAIRMLTERDSSLNELYAHTPEKKRELNFEVWEKPVGVKTIINGINAVQKSLNKVPQS